MENGDVSDEKENKNMKSPNNMKITDKEMKRSQIKPIHHDNVFTLYPWNMNSHE